MTGFDHTPDVFRLTITEVVYLHRFCPGPTPQLLVEAALVSSRVLKDPGPEVRLLSLGSDGLEFSVLFWIADPQNGQVNVRSEVNFAVLSGLRGAGIDIPYPQRVVRFQGPLQMTNEAQPLPPSPR